MPVAANALHYDTRPGRPYHFGSDVRGNETTGATNMGDSLFAGLKVIDCASWIAGPCAATILSDFGADVIKLEPPGAGDPWRASTPVPGKKVDYYWQLTSRNKRSLALDLKQPEGQAILHRLVSTADVFVTNFPLPVRARLRMSAADLLPLNRRLIYASFTAYGEDGDEAAKTGFDSTAYWARTGLMDMVRAAADTPPARSMPGMGDHPSGTGLYAAIVTALYRREKTGEGGIVRSSLLQNGLWANACAVQTRLFGEHVPHRPLREDPPNALANHYRTRDGRWFIMALFNEQRQLRGFLSAIGREELTDDPRFATTDARKQNAAALVEILDEVFAQRDLAVWRTILDGVGVTFGIVGTVNEVSDDAQMQAAGALVPFEDGKGLTVASPFHIDGLQQTAARRAPGIGQHSESVLQEAGYSGDEISALRARSVVA
jgi:crotonobetainyl-CoA:carnitine CoA-transferase CaiB-like acyl-CoA transferase